MMNDFKRGATSSGFLIFCLLVFIAFVVGVSLIYNGAIDLAKDKGAESELIEQVERNSRTIEGLKTDLRVFQKRLDDLGGKQLLLSEGERLQGQLSALEGEIGDDKLAYAELDEELLQTIEGFKTYQTENRREIWSKLKGQSIDSGLFVKGGDFKNPQIVQVSPLGVRIQHQAGLTLIPVDELAPEFQEQLDLTPESAERLLMALHARAKRKKALDSREKELLKEARKPDAAAVDREEERELLLRKNRVADLARKIMDLKAETDRALASHAQSRSRASGADGETWKDRADEFIAVNRRYYEQYKKAVLEVKEIDPSFRPEPLKLNL